MANASVTPNVLTAQAALSTSLFDAEQSANYSNVHADASVSENTITAAAEIDDHVITAAGDLSIKIVSGDAPVYSGAYEVTPATETQTLLTANKLLTGNVVVNPIPSNYGLITWTGAVLTVT